MARKLKFSPKQYQQPGLFDLTDDIMARHSKEAPIEEELPPIDDFVVNVVAGNHDEEAAKAKPVEGVELDRGLLQQADAIMFMSFGSGSSGNCSYIGDSEGGFLIDAGVEYDLVRDGLKANGLSFHHIKGICLTHDHSDHVRFVYTIVRKYPHIGVYCTPKALSGLLRRHSISRRIKDYHHPIYKEFAFSIGNFEITAFEVSHDGTDNSGYFITHGDHRFAVATDLGCITPRVDHYMRQARYIMIEANYDAEMLRVGPYPMFLKARIMKSTGHLDNVDAGRFLAEIATPQLTHVFLCHLSKDNNTPEKALGAVATALLGGGVASIGDGSGSLESRNAALQLVALPRYDVSPLYSLRLK